MKALVYISQAKTDFELESLLELAEQAAASNEKGDISGYLWFKDNQFLQYIEGDATAVDQLMRSIETDKRHEVLYHVEDYALAERRFPDWRMRYFHAQDDFEIGFESILSELLLTMKTACRQGSHDTLEKSAWRIVESISRYRSKFL